MWLYIKIPSSKLASTSFRLSLELGSSNKWSNFYVSFKLLTVPTTL